MFKFVNKVVLSVALIASSSIAHASLITNGSFEQTAFINQPTAVGLVFNTDLQAYQTKNSAWDVFYTLPGWETTYGKGIELQKNVVTSSQNGSHHVELDSAVNGLSNSVMTQTLQSLTVGANYQLEFFYKPRTKVINDNGIHVFWYDANTDFDFDMKPVLISDSTAGLMPTWSKQTVSFTAQAQSMNLSFASVGKENTLGGLIDNVSLTQTTSVPEPSTFIFLFTAIALLVMRHYKKSSV